MKKLSVIFSMFLLIILVVIQYLIIHVPETTTVYSSYLIEVSLRLAVLPKLLILTSLFLIFGIMFINEQKNVKELTIIYFIYIIITAFYSVYYFRHVHFPEGNLFLANSEQVIVSSLEAIIISIKATTFILLSIYGSYKLVKEYDRKKYLSFTLKK